MGWKYLWNPNINLMGKKPKFILFILTKEANSRFQHIPQKISWNWIYILNTGMVVLKILQIFMQAKFKIDRDSQQWMDGNGM